MKRKLCLVLAVLMLVSVTAIFASCDKSNGDGASTTVTTVPQGGPNDGPIDDSHLYEDLPTGSYEGYAFQFLNNISDYAITTIVPEETTDTVDAAIFARNSYVKEALGIELSEVRQGYNEVKSTMSSLTSSNDFEYDAVYNELWMQTPLAQTGTYIEVDDLASSLNLSKPWWFTDAMAGIAIDGNGYELFGDLQLMYYDSIWGMTFNQQDLIDNKQAFPYDLVRSGDWTLAELEKIMKATYQKPGAEHYAMASHKDFISAMIAACDFVLVAQDDDDVLKVFEDEERFVGIYAEIMNLFFASNGYDKMNYVVPDYNATAYTSGEWKTDADGWSGKFPLGKSTFMAGTIGDIRRVRSAEFAYGIIPFPKYDTDQEKYVSWVYRGAASLGVPSTQPNVERTCVILENLAAYSYKLVKHEYYDVVVQGRTVRDNDSIEMLDIIFGHTDLGVTYLGIDTSFRLGLSDQIRKSMSDNVTEVMVDIGSVMGSVSTNIESLIEAYK